MTERDLARIAGQQHQRQRADRSKKNLTGKIEQEGRREKGKQSEREDQESRGLCAQPGLQQRQILRVAGMEIAAGARTGLNTVELLARSKQAPRPHNQHGDQDQERDDVGQQGIDVVDQQHFGAGDDQRSDERADKAIKSADQRGRKCLEADNRHARWSDRNRARSACRQAPR